MSESNSTKMAFANGMKELMDQHPFLKISVGEICDHFLETLKPVVEECLDEAFSDGENFLFLRVFYTDAILVFIERWILENANLPSAEFIKLLKRSIIRVPDETI